MSNALSQTLALNVFGISMADARKLDICINCREPVRVALSGTELEYNPEMFYSAAGIREYEITAICECCFDKIFQEV